jgi:hypothetical protein
LREIETTERASGGAPRKKTGVRLGPAAVWRRALSANNGPVAESLTAMAQARGWRGASVSRCERGVCKARAQLI